MKPTDVLKKPIITEKSLLEATEKNVYAFEVERNANKGQIREAIEKQFAVKVIDLKTVTIPGKTRRRGARRARALSTPSRKKAYIKLAADNRIDLFEVSSR